MMIVVIGSINEIVIKLLLIDICDNARLRIILIKVSNEAF